MNTPSGTPVLARVGRLVLLLCAILSVKIARASEDDVGKPGLRQRLVAVPRKVGDGLGALVSPAKYGVGTVSAKVQVGVSTGLGVARSSIVGAGSTIAAGAGQGYRVVRNGGAYCVELLTTTGAAIPRPTISSDPWVLGPDIEKQIAAAWAGPNTFEAALREHLRLIFEARVQYATSGFNFATVSEAEAFQKTIGRVWSPPAFDYSDFLRDSIDPRIYPECVHAVEVFKLTRELGQDFDERFDIIRAYLGSLVSWDSWIPWPGHIAVRLARLVAGPILDHGNENARIGALWEVARLMPPAVRERLVVSIEHHIKNQAVPESERARFRRFVYSGEYDRVNALIKAAQAAGVIGPAHVGAEHLIVRSKVIDGPESQEVRDELRAALKPTHKDHAELIEAIGLDGVRILSRVFTHDEYPEFDNGDDSTTPADVRAKQLENLIVRYQWARISTEEREGIESALIALKNAHLGKNEFIATLTDVHDNEFRRVFLKSLLPDFLTKRAPRDYPR